MAECSAGFETGANGNDVATTDAGNATAWDSITKTGSGLVKYDNAHIAHGSLACKLTSGTASQCYGTWDTPLGTVTNHYGRQYCYFTANPGSGLFIVSFFNAVVKAATIAINATGTVYAEDSVGSGGSTTATISLNQWIRLEWHIVHLVGTGSIEVKLFNSAESDTVTETLSLTGKNTLAQATNGRFGQGVGVANAPNAYAYWMDSIVAGAGSYPGPVGAGGGGGSGDQRSVQASDHYYYYA